MSRHPQWVSAKLYWRSIETAPKAPVDYAGNGPMILGHCPCTDTPWGHEQAIFPIYWWGSQGEWNTIHDLYEPLKPTHWMPLPEPPADPAP